MDAIFSRVVYIVSTIIRVVTTLTRPASEWVLDLLYKLVIGQTRRLPTIRNPILLMTATEIAERIRTRQLKAEDVMKAYIERCKEIHPLINAQVDERFDDALKEAISVDKMLEKRDKSPVDLARQFPLLGVPFTCKEVIGVKGLAQTCGLKEAKDRKAPKDCDAAALYRKAGAIPVTVTNVPETCMWWESANNIFGWTKNPYDNCRTVGGSSGGEGAIITACGAVIGIGNDLAGSIRIPASFCGIYGHKPSRHLISNVGHFPDDIPAIDYYASTGPMCRYAQDLPLLVKVLAGDNISKIKIDEKVNFQKVKIFYMEEFPGILLSAAHDIRAAVRKGAKHFEEEFGVTATKLNIPELRNAFYMWESKLLETDIPPFKSSLETNGNISLYWEFVKSLFRRSDHTWPALYFAAVDRRNKDEFYYQCLEEYKVLKQKLEEYLDNDALLLIPTHPDPPPHYLMTIPKYPNIAYTCIFSILGYPSTQIPAGMSRSVPIGIQAISSIYKDHLTLAAAVELDKVFGGWINPGPVEL